MLCLKYQAAGVSKQRAMAIDLDEVLSELGQFGRSQIQTYVLLSITVWMLGANYVSYVFSAGDLKYRCFIPECDDVKTQTYHTEWLHLAVPMEERSGISVPRKCYKYITTNSSSAYQANGTCSADQFLNTSTRCDKWVFDGHETTILNEWNLTCEESQWKLGFVGTVNNVGNIISLPIIGYLSDRYGRKRVLVWGLAVSCVLGIARTFAQNYTTFVVLEFLVMLVNGGIYSPIFILAMEVVGFDKRVLGAMILHAVFSLGLVELGLVSWWVQNWRLMLRIIYIPSLLFIPYIWFIPESVRWLLTNGHFVEAKNIIHKMARKNGVQLSGEVMKNLEVAALEETVKVEDKGSDLMSAIGQVFRSRVLLLRLLNCCFCWATNALVYYGLSLNAVSLAGNKYLNFILVAFVELPGIFIDCFVMNWWGRRWTMCVSMVLSGACCVGFIFTPPELTSVTLTLFLLGKLTITMSFMCMYTFITEVFPTEIRNSMLGISAMSGCIGSMVATQSNTMRSYMELLPLILFASTATTSGLLTLLLPETKGIKLPDTVQQSMDIGTNHKDRDDQKCSNSSNGTVIQGVGV